MTKKNEVAYREQANVLWMSEDCKYRVIHLSRFESGGNRSDKVIMQESFRKPDGTILWLYANDEDAVAALFSALIDLLDLKSANVEGA